MKLVRSSDILFVVRLVGRKRKLNGVNVILFPTGFGTNLKCVPGLIRDRKASSKISL